MPPEAPTCPVCQGPCHQGHGSYIYCARAHAPNGPCSCWYYEEYIWQGWERLGTKEWRWDVRHETPQARSKRLRQRNHHLARMRAKRAW